MPPKCDIGVLLPLFAHEEDWPQALRGALYALGMVYSFLGVAIIADLFVASIEVVTSRRRKVNQNGTMKTVRVWNSVVATLSLMALGSSAPEIGLSVVDLFKSEFHFAPLGASTIVGSAAFNLFCIIAVCMCVIPLGEVRQIKEVGAFSVTAVMSTFAYLWLAFILIISTPDVVDIWEALLTFLFLPMLIWVSYQVDIGFASFVRRLPFYQKQEQEAAARGSVVGFHAERVVLEGSVEGFTAEVEVKREGDASERALCSFHLESLGAVPDYDYVDIVGELVFSEGVTTQVITLDILPKSPYAVPCELLLILEDAEGCDFDPLTDGGANSTILTIRIGATSGCRGGMLHCYDSFVGINHIRRGMDDWVGQIHSAIFVNGSLGEQREASASDWTGHLIALPWKLLFMLVPPSSLFGGWLCFWFCLAVIGGLTAFISDLAEIFGCVAGIPDSVTAITFVALGTSMPDLFASLSAAKEDPYADASIVNVTGSNAVNVFLGLGLPWTVGSIYWVAVGRTDEWVARYPAVASRISGAAFVVQSEDIGFSVVVLVILSLAALLIIHLRRKFLGAELGGALIPKLMSGVAMIVFWLCFIGVCSWGAVNFSKAEALEIAIVFATSSTVAIIVLVLTVVAIVRFAPKEPLEQSEPESATTTGTTTARPTALKRSNSMKSCGSIGEGALGLTDSIGRYCLKPRFNRTDKKDDGKSPRVTGEAKSAGSGSGVEDPEVCQADSEFSQSIHSDLHDVTEE